MISRTVRYFKLMYIVAGILTSNEVICQTVDGVRITPRVEVRDILQPKYVYRGVEKVVPKKWLNRCDVSRLMLMKQRVHLFVMHFNMWTIPNYFVDLFSKYINMKLGIGNDCDMIYNR